MTRFTVLIIYSALIMFFLMQKQEEWRIVFWITLIVYVIAVFFYTWLCSGERQPWASVNKRQVVEKDT